MSRLILTCNRVHHCKRIAVFYPWHYRIGNHRTTLTFHVIDKSSYLSLGSLKGVISEKKGIFLKEKAEQTLVPSYQCAARGDGTLQRLSATIDTLNNSITFQGCNDRIKELPTPAIAVCKRRLPAYSHTFLDVKGPRDSCVLIQTEPYIQLLIRCFPLPQGSVKFDTEGKAVVKIANLGQTTTFIQPGQKIASIEQLPNSSDTDLPVISPISTKKTKACRQKIYILGNHFQPSNRRPCLFSLTISRFV